MGYNIWRLSGGTGLLDSDYQRRQEAGSAMTEFISTLADVSTMWLVCLSFIFCLIPLALAGAMAYGAWKLVAALRPVLERGQEGMAQVADGADRASKRVAAPFIATSAFASRVRSTLCGLSRIIGREA